MFLMGHRSVIFRAVLHRSIVILLFLCSFIGRAQTLSADSLTAMSYSRSVSIPLNAYQLFDKALEAWTWTFGQQPGATLRRSDRESGMLEGSARVNFRSEMLNGREESMGTITFRVSIQVRAGGSRITVHELTHSGNRAALRGGIHLGVLTRGPAPQERVPGLGRANAERLYAEVKQRAEERIVQLMQSFEARLRANAAP